MKKKILFAGESWTSYTTHIKGFDSFYTSIYETGAKWLIAALEEGGYEVNFLPNHLAIEQFPFEMEELNQYQCIILSDISSDTLYLTPATFNSGLRRPNRCQLIKDYVLNGGGLLMVGGYMTFTGVNAKGRWGVTPVQDVLPVRLLDVDDRREHPEGVYPTVVERHEALMGIEGDWPYFLGYNKCVAMDDAIIPVKINNDPFIAFAERGNGRTAAFSSDCSPHWGSSDFVNWKYYNKLWQGIVNWLVKK